MLTKQGYRVDAQNGRGFELEVFDIHGGDIERTEEYVSFSDTLKDAVHTNGEQFPNTWTAHELHRLVGEALRKGGVYGELKLFKSVGTLADALYETDAFFHLTTRDEHGRERVVVATIDAFYTKHENVIKWIELYCQEIRDFRFEGLDTSHNLNLSMSVARNFLIGRYAEFQSVLYNFKKELKREYKGKEKETKEKSRPSNHFILVPFDVERGRGLRALARLIAGSLLDQLKVDLPVYPLTAS